MSKFTDELREIANEQDLGPAGPDVKQALRSAADLLDEAEKALETIAISARSAVTMQTIARTTLARIRGEQP